MGWAFRLLVWGLDKSGIGSPHIKKIGLSNNKHAARVPSYFIIHEEANSLLGA